MPKTKIAVTVDAALIEQLDELIADAQFPNRSQAVEAALAEKLDRLRRTRLARECAKLDPHDERAWAEEGLQAELGLWPEY
jgi:metal-responsive CopG/Arc/MetJ family transcriptional regulator